MKDLTVIYEVLRVISKYGELPEFVKDGGVLKGTQYLLVPAGYTTTDTIKNALPERVELVVTDDLYFTGETLWKKEEWRDRQNLRDGVKKENSADLSYTPPFEVRYGKHCDVLREPVYDPKAEALWSRLRELPAVAELRLSYNPLGITDIEHTIYHVFLHTTEPTCLRQAMFESGTADIIIEWHGPKDSKNNTVHYAAGTDLLGFTKYEVELSQRQKDRWARQQQATGGRVVQIGHSERDGILAAPDFRTFQIQEQRDGKIEITSFDDLGREVSTGLEKRWWSTATEAANTIRLYRSDYKIAYEIPEPKKT